MSLERVLVANRGEIAVRVIRACRELGLTSVAVYSDADAGALHTRLADAAVNIGPAPAGQSYLNADALLEAAKATGADAVHPGYGFLAENALFAEACAAAGLTFVGPPAAVIDRMGNKIAGRALAEAAGVPVVPGRDGIADLEAAIGAAEEVGYPVMIKAAAGGGGRGIRIAADADGLRAALPQAQAEAQAAFADSSVYIERALTNPRHIEIQVLADLHGNVVHLFERDCSLQRRKQKLIEEAPSAVLSPEQRERMGAAAVALAREAGYSSAGTIEFLVQGDEFAFIEMNTRIQVEHGITEMITGVDLVAEQLRVAMGEPLAVEQADLHPEGVALELRICAEDPARDFFPSPGSIDHLVLPSGPGIRWDSGFEQGDSIQPYYDSLLGKLMAWAPDREAAIARALRALGELQVGPIATTAAMHGALLRRPAFVGSEFDVQSIDAWLADGSLLDES